MAGSRGEGRHAGAGRRERQREAGEGDWKGKALGDGSGRQGGGQARQGAEQRRRGKADCRSVADETTSDRGRGSRRGGGYALATQKALPEAIQVADRSHLMENASHAFLDAVRKSVRIRAAIGATTINPALLIAAEMALSYGVSEAAGISRRAKSLRISKS